MGNSTSDQVTSIITEDMRKHDEALETAFEQLKQAIEEAETSEDFYLYSDMVTSYSIICWKKATLCLKQ